MNENYVIQISDEPPLYRLIDREGNDLLGKSCSSIYTVEPPYAVIRTEDKEEIIEIGSGESLVSASGIFFDRHGEVAAMIRGGTLEVVELPALKVLYSVSNVVPSSLSPCGAAISFKAGSKHLLFSYERREVVDFHFKRHGPFHSGYSLVRDHDGVKHIASLTGEVVFRGPLGISSQYHPTEGYWLLVKRDPGRHVHFLNLFTCKVDWSVEVGYCETVRQGVTAFLRDGSVNLGNVRNRFVQELNYSNSRPTINCSKYFCFTNEKRQHVCNADGTLLCEIPSTIPDGELVLDSFFIGTNEYGRSWVYHLASDCIVDMSFDERPSWNVDGLSCWHELHGGVLILKDGSILKSSDLRF